MSAACPPVNAGGGVTAPAFPAIRARLYAKREDLRNRMHAAMGELNIERQTEQMDAARDAAQRESTAAEVRILRALAGEVECAIRRMELGVFGECVSCGNTMLAKRLEAIPWAADCLRCTENKERG